MDGGPWFPRWHGSLFEQNGSEKRKKKRQLTSQCGPVIWFVLAGWFQSHRPALWDAAPSRITTTRARSAGCNDRKLVLRIITRIYCERMLRGATSLASPLRDEQHSWSTRSVNSRFLASRRHAEDIISQATQKMARQDMWRSRKTLTRHREISPSNHREEEESRTDEGQKAISELHFFPPAVHADRLLLAPHARRSSSSSAQLRLPLLLLLL